jgi:hypothetical protein
MAMKLHNQIRNIPSAFGKIERRCSIYQIIKSILPVTARTVIHKLNFRKWPEIIETAKKMGLDQISFLPADISSHAFNRATLWDKDRQDEVLPTEDDLLEMQEIIDHIIQKYARSFCQSFYCGINFKNPKDPRPLHCVVWKKCFPL